MDSLFNKLREVKDNRKGQGKKYSLASILRLLFISKLCGYTDIKGA